MADLLTTLRLTHRLERIHDSIDPQRGVPFGWQQLVRLRRFKEKEGEVL